MIRDYSQLQICNASSSAYLSFVSYGRRPSTVHSSLENVCRLISNTACECHEWFLMAIYLARRVFCTSACNNWSFRETDAKQEREITCMRAFKVRITRRIVARGESCAALGNWELWGDDGPGPASAYTCTASWCVLLSPPLCVSLQSCKAD